MSTLCRGTFLERGESPTLPDEQLKTFNSVVARLLYVAKRVRPDILFTVNMMMSRVEPATDRDWVDLMHLVGYIRATKEK